MAAALCAVACTRDKPVVASDFQFGLSPAMPKPDFTLTATDGQPYPFKTKTAGKVALVFFGYTNCPDVCPVHAANIAAVVRDMSWADRQRITFVFITTDPDRDTLPAIRAWLNHFDSTFVGLRGTREEVNALAKKLGLPGAVSEGKGPDGSYGVGHAGVVLAFSADDSAHVMYPGGVRQQDWAADLPKLLAIKGR